MVRRGRVVMLVLLLVACGSGDPSEEEAQDVVDAVEEGMQDAEEVLEDLPEELDELAEQLTEELEEQQAASGGGGAELTIDGETWTFDSALCAFGPDEIGDEDAEFVLSALADGLQLYVSIDGFGHVVTLDDIEDFEDPSVVWSAGDLTFGMGGNAEEFIEVDGKQVRAEAEFIDARDEMLSTTAPGTLEATCP
jgi:hypothetical protein